MSTKNIALVVLVLVVVLALYLAYDKHTRNSRGVGDGLGHGFEFLGIKKYPGCGCAERHRWLNKLLPYSK